MHWLATAGRDAREPRPYHFVVNNIAALRTRRRDRRRHRRPARLRRRRQLRTLVQVLRDIEMPSLDSYIVYAEEMRSVARVQAFRDFLVAKAQRWTY